MLGIPTTIVMPHDAPSVKIARARTQGAQVVLYDRRIERREDIAARIAELLWRRRSAAAAVFASFCS
jgi:threonine dehydratase